MAETEYMAANAAAKYVGIADPRSIQKRVEPDAWHVNAGGKRVPVYAVETLDEHAEALREAARPGYHERVEFKLVGRRPNGKPILQVKPDSVVDEPIAPEPVVAEPVVAQEAPDAPAASTDTPVAQEHAQPLAQEDQDIVLRYLRGHANNGRIFRDALTDMDLVLYNTKLDVHRFSRALLALSAAGLVWSQGDAKFVKAAK